jgi:hypothetical protein
MLNPSRRDGVLNPAFAFIETDASGAFRIANVPPGDYRIDVVSKARMSAIGGTGSSAARPGGEAEESASVPVTVAGQDIHGLVVRTSRGFQIEGRVIVEGAASLPANAQVTVRSLPTVPQGMSASLMAVSGAVERDGRFVVSGAAGEQLIRVYGLPSDWSLKAVRLPGGDVTDDGFEVRADVRSVEVVVTARPPVVSGSVRDADGTMEEDGAWVIAFAADASKWPLRGTRYVSSARLDRDGRFSITGLPPGSYYAAVVDALEPDWPSPDSLELLRRSATAFSLYEGETTTLALVRR